MMHHGSVNNSNFAHRLVDCAHTISYVRGKLIYIFASGYLTKLTDFKKSNCFAALIFDKRILPYSLRGGIQLFRTARVFIKALQSKDFSEILLICVNFHTTSSRLFKKSRPKTK